MSLREAILDIADQMEKDAVTWLDGDVVNAGELRRGLQGYARQLRSAVKAAGPDIEGMIAKVVDRPAPIQPKREAEAGSGLTLAFCVGGPADQVGVPLDPQMPFGAKMTVEGSVYQLDCEGFSAVLRWCGAEADAAYREQLAKQRGGLQS